MRVNIPSFFKSKVFLAVVAIVAELILLLFVFRVGMLVGFRKANFSLQWGQNYHHMFGEPRRGMMREFRRDDYVSGSGASGTVLAVTPDAITIRGNDAVERSIAITAKTTIQKNRGTISVGDIAVNDEVMAMGAPSTTGQIEATFIRVFSAR